MSPLTFIAERRIQEAIERGDFDNLPLKGQPLPREDLSAVPAELRMCYKVLKNAGYLPEELELRQEILSLETLLEVSLSTPDLETSRRKLNLRRLQLDMLMEKSGRSLATLEYERKLEARLIRRD